MTSNSPAQSVQSTSNSRRFPSSILPARRSAEALARDATGEVSFDVLDVRSEIRFRFVGEKHCLKQFDLLLLRRIHQTGKRFESVEGGDDFEGVSLVDEESLSLRRVVDFLRTFMFRKVSDCWDQRVRIRTPWRRESRRRR